tara:strand:- start:700 stop:1446 length:747 start_codon:yes stop_codon:yes gene_type:complete
MAVKCKQLVYTPTTPLTFRITGGTKELTAHKSKEGIIHALEDPNGLNLTLGLKTKIKKLNYKINIIEEVWKKNVLAYDIHIDKRTKASIFLLPMFGGTRNLFMWNQLFMNCFLHKENDTPCIQLLYRSSKDPLFLKFQRTLTKFKSFIRQDDIHIGFVLFTFNIPNRQMMNYEKFINGQYSKFSKLFKMTLLEFHNFEVDDLIGQVIFKSLFRKEELEQKLGCELPEDSELLSIVDQNTETFNPEIYF